MANTASAKKRVRQTNRKTSVRLGRVNTVRRYVRKVEEAILAGDKSIAKDAYRIMQPKIMSGVNFRVFHRNTVARKLSRLSKRIKAMD